MADSAQPSETPFISPEAKGDEFGPPHAQKISDTLQLWILVPGLLLVVLFIGYSIYRLMNTQGERERKKAEKKRLKQEKKEKKKTK